jgi:hypothetical protein
LEANPGNLQSRGNPEIRNFLSKTSKAFDTLHHHHAQDSLQIEALKKKDELVNKRQKKIAVDCRTELQRQEEP